MRTPRQKAVALRYAPDERMAPHIVAAGEGEIAKQILEIADLHDVPVYEQPEVVEALVKLEVGTEIPPRGDRGMGFGSRGFG